MSTEGNKICREALVKFEEAGLCGEVVLDDNQDNGGRFRVLKMNFFGWVISNVKFALNIGGYRNRLVVERMKVLNELDMAVNPDYAEEKIAEGHNGRSIPESDGKEIEVNAAAGRVLQKAPSITHLHSNVHPEDRKSGDMLVDSQQWVLSDGVYRKAGNPERDRHSENSGNQCKRSDFLENMWCHDRKMIYRKNVMKALRKTLDAAG